MLYTYMICDVKLLNVYLYHIYMYIHQKSPEEHKSWRIFTLLTLDQADQAKMDRPAQHGLIGSQPKRRKIKSGFKSADNLSWNETIFQEVKNGWNVSPFEPGSFHGLN